jgi:hypothetical protein
MRILTLILLLFPIILFGQNINETDIVKDYCEQAESLDWESKSVEEIASELSQIAVRIRQDHSETINQIKEKFKADKPELTDKELDKEFTIRLIESLADECDTYVQLTRNLINPSPKENKTLHLIAEKIDSIMEQNKNLSYPEQLSKADNQIFNIIMDNESQVNKDYKDGFADPKLADDVGIYLLYKSNRYYKAYLVSGSIKMFN